MTVLDMEGNLLWNTVHDQLQKHQHNKKESRNNTQKKILEKLQYQKPAIKLKKLFSFSIPIKFSPEFSKNTYSK